jgi:hypothetical protein
VEAFKNDPHIATIPAPHQYEHDSGGQVARNADFVVLDTEAREAIGVQTKVSFSEEKHKKYDDRFVICVDGEIDFGNIGMRRDKLDKTQKVAGMIAAEHVLHVPTHGKRSPILQRYTEGEAQRNIVAAKMFARGVVSPQSSAKREAATRIKERITSALYADTRAR